MISVDGSLFIQIVNFIVLIFVLNKILYGPIRNILRERGEKVSDLENSIDASEKGAKEKDEEYVSGIKTARAEGMKIKDELIAAAEQEEKKIIQGINEKAQAELTKIKDKIAKDAEEVRKTLLQEVDRFAIEIGEKILGRAV